MYHTKSLFLQAPSCIQDNPKTLQRPSWVLRNPSRRFKYEFKRFQYTFERCCRSICVASLICKGFIQPNHCFCNLQAASNTLQIAFKAPHVCSKTLLDGSNMSSKASKIHSKGAVEAYAFDSLIRKGCMTRNRCLCNLQAASKTIQSAFKAFMGS